MNSQNNHTNDPDQPAQSSWKTFLYHPSTKFYLAFAVLVALILLLITSRPHENGTPLADASLDAAGAWNTCVHFIEVQERVNAKEAPIFTESRVKELPNSRFTVEMTLPASGITFECQMKASEKFSWQLENLIVK